MKTLKHTIKHALLSLVCLSTAFAGSALAQTSNDTMEALPSESINEAIASKNGPVDTTKITFKGVNVWIMADSTTKDSLEAAKDAKKENTFKHWAGIDLGVGGYLTPDNKTVLPADADFMQLNYAESITWSFNFLEKGINLAGENAKIVTGLGITFNHYSLENNVLLQNTPEGIIGAVDSVNAFDRNKLKTTYLNLPLMLAFNTGKNRSKSFHIATGVVLGYRIGSRYKQKYEIEGDVFKPVTRSSYHQNPFVANATARIGYGQFNIFATYSLTPLFESGKGPELYPFSVGVQLVSF